MTEQEKRILMMLKKLSNDRNMGVCFMLIVRNNKKHDMAEKWLKENPNATEEDIWALIKEMF